MLTGLHLMASSVCFLIALAQGATAHDGLGPPTANINLKSSPTNSPTGHMTIAIVSVEVSSSQMTLACIKLTKKI